MLDRRESLIEDMQNMRAAAVLSANGSLSIDERQRYERLCSVYEPWGGVGTEIEQPGLSATNEDAPYVLMTPADSEVLAKIVAAHSRKVASF